MRLFPADHSTQVQVHKPWIRYDVLRHLTGSLNSDLTGITLWTCNHVSVLSSEKGISYTTYLSLVGLEFFFFFLAPHPWHMEVPRLGVKLQLQLPAYTTVTATQDPSHILDLHSNLWQCQILTPRSKARDRTHSLMETSEILNPLSHHRNSWDY